MKFKEFSVWKGITKEKISPMLAIIWVANVALLLVSNIIAAKTFTVFPAGTLISEPIVLPSAIFCYAFVIILSDVQALLLYSSLLALFIISPFNIY